MTEGICPGVSSWHQHSSTQRTPHFAEHPKRMVEAIHGAFAGQVLADMNSNPEVHLALPETQIDNLNLPIVIEFCCDQDSEIGKLTSERCCVLRVDKDMDALNHRTMSNLLARIVPWRTLLWSSIPCTGGSPWQSVNSGTAEGRERIEAHKPSPVSSGTSAKSLLGRSLRMADTWLLNGLNAALTGNGLLSRSSSLSLASSTPLRTDANGAW